MHSFKIIDGTRSSQKRLCDSCRHSIIMKGAGESEEMIHCEVLPTYTVDARDNNVTRFHRVGNVPMRVVECSHYLDKNTMTKWEMEDIAWLLKVSKGEVLGFKPPEKKRE